MKLIYIVNARIPTEKAHGLQIAKTCEAFSAANIDVELVVPRRNNPIKEDCFKYYKLEHKFKVTEVFCLDWVDMTRFGLYAQTISFSFSSLFYVLRKKADIIYSRHNYLESFFLHLLGRKVIVEIHEPPKRFFCMYRAILKRISRKVLVAHKLKDFFANWNIDPKTWIIAPNGVDIKEFNKINRDKNIWNEKFNIKDKVALYVGHFYKWKGVYTLIDSAEFLDNGIRIVLIGGTNEDQKKVKDYVAKKKLNNIFIHDFLPHDQVIKFLKSADVLILPNTAKEERSSKYTTPIKLFEYMSSGVPIVASRLQSFSLYLKNEVNAIMCKPDDHHDLADKINKVLKGTELIKKISAQAFKDVGEYTWDKRVEKILKFINS